MGRILPEQNRSLRRKLRAKKGPLSSQVVTQRTRSTYMRACTWFFSWMVAMRMGIPSDALEFDAVVCTGIEYLWQSGDGRSFAGHLISGLEFFCTFLHANLKGSWRLWRAWGRQELPTRAPPLTPLMAWALASVIWEWGFCDCAVLIILGFKTFLRTDEL